MIGMFVLGHDGVIVAAILVPFTIILLIIAMIEQGIHMAKESREWKAEQIPKPPPLPLPRTPKGPPPSRPPYTGIVG